MRRYIDQGEGGYLDTYSSTTENGAKVRFTFTGKGIEIFGPIRPDQATVEVYVNGARDATLNLRGGTRRQFTWYQNLDLPLGEHQIEIVKVGEGRLVIDGFLVHQSKSRGFISFEIP